MVERNAGVPPERRIEFRIGIHLGDVVEESDGDLMGDGVNIAARLEGVAERRHLPLRGCLSPSSMRLDLAVSDLGEKELKNIALPMRVYSLRAGVPAEAKPATEAKPAPQAKTTTAKKRSALAPLFLTIAALLIVIARAAGISSTPAGPRPSRQRRRLGSTRARAMARIVTQSSACQRGDCSMSLTP
jgi:adenylate cyclase